jgi:hypothetical protein
VGATKQQIAAYVEEFTAQWPKHQIWSWAMQPTMADSYTAGQIAEALLSDAEFRALRLGTWLNTPSGEVLAEAVTMLAPQPYSADINLLVDGLQIAAQRQQDEARQKIALGLLGGAVAAVAVSAARG